MSSGQQQQYDVLVVGGGPAGLTAAAALARQYHTTLVIDSGVYRNARADHMHNVIGFDHANPAELRRKARADLLARYPSVSFEKAKVTAAKKIEDGSFVLTAEDGATEYRGKKLIIASGITDQMLDIEGYADCWGYGIFHCLFCHGYEQAGQQTVGLLAVGMLSKPELAMHIIPQAARLSKSVKVYTNGDEAKAEEFRKLIEATNLPATVESRKITKFALKSPGASSAVNITLQGGQENTEGFISHIPNAELNGPFVKDLGLELGAAGEIASKSPMLETSVPGCFAAGDIMTPLRAVATAANNGMIAGVAAVMAVQGDAMVKK